jgi:hypothetical protein
LEKIDKKEMLQQKLRFVATFFGFLEILATSVTNCSPAKSPRHFV